MFAGEEHATDIMKVTASLSAKFYSLGMMLGLPASELDKIRGEFYHDWDQALKQVIIAWLRLLYDVTNHGCPSWKRLVEAIASEAGGKNRALAKTIADIHQGISFVTKSAK